MTKSTTSTKATEAPATTVLQHLDPADLLVDVNVRHDARLDATFLASVRDLGVLVPIVAVRTDDGATRVRYGHRRSLAAVAAKRPTVPVLVVADESTEDAAQVERLVGQYAENEHRTGLSAAEQVGVVAQLAAFGISAHQIAKRTHTPREAVDAALTVSGSPLAKAATARYDFLTLDQAAVVAEFEDDADTVKSLVAAAQTGQFDHVAQRARDARTEAIRREQFTAALREQGITVLDANSGLSPLHTLTGPDGVVLTAETHRDCPGHAARVERRSGWVDSATGYPPPRQDSTDADDLDDEDDADDLDEEEDDADDLDEEEDGGDEPQDDGSVPGLGHLPGRALRLHRPHRQRPPAALARPRQRQRPAQAVRHDPGAGRGQARRAPRRHRVQQGVEGIGRGPPHVAARPAGTQDRTQGVRRPDRARAGRRREHHRPRRGQPPGRRPARLRLAHLRPRQRPQRPGRQGQRGPRPGPRPGDRARRVRGCHPTSGPGGTSTAAPAAT